VTLNNLSNGPGQRATSSEEMWAPPYGEGFGISLRLPQNCRSSRLLSLCLCL